MTKSIVEVANEIQPFVPSDCRIDIQWSDDALVISKGSALGFAVTRRHIEDGAYVDAALVGLAMLNGPMDVIP